LDGVFRAGDGGGEDDGQTSGESDFAEEGHERFPCLG